MTSDSEIYKENGKSYELENIVYSLLSGDLTIDELKSKLVDCDKCPDSLEEIIQDCLKNRMEKKCCPDKVINELKQKIGYASVIFITALGSFEMFFII